MDPLGHRSLDIIEEVCFIGEKGSQTIIAPPPKPAILGRVFGSVEFGGWVALRRQLRRYVRGFRCY